MDENLDHGWKWICINKRIYYYHSAHCTCTLYVTFVTNCALCVLLYLLRTFNYEMLYAKCIIIRYCALRTIYCTLGIKLRIVYHILILIIAHFQLRTVHFQSCIAHCAWCMIYLWYICALWVHEYNTMRFVTYCTIMHYAFNR